VKHKSYKYTRTNKLNKVIGKQDTPGNNHELINRTNYKELQKTWHKTGNNKMPHKT